MLQRVLIIVITCLLVKVAGNPINPYDLPFISEVQIIDSTLWTIELNANSYYGPNRIIRMLPSTHDTTTEIELSLHSKTYHTKLLFDTAGIALLTRKAIVGIQSNEKVILHDNDTIKITTPADTTHSYQLYYIFVLKPIKQGNSLARTGSTTTTFETSRTSIGKPNGPFNTIYNFTITDAHSKPIPDLFVYRDTIIIMPYYKYVCQTDCAGKFSYSIKINSPVSLNLFTDSTGIYTIYGGNSKSIFSWNGGYIDTLQTKDTTLILNFANTVQKFKRNYNFKFSTLQLSNDKHLITISSIQPFPKAFVNISDLNGRLIASMKTPIPNKGTYSFIFDAGQKAIAAGHYTCTLVADEKTRNVFSLLIK